MMLLVDYEEFKTLKEAEDWLTEGDERHFRRGL